MRYKVLKSSLDGISGGVSEYTKIDDVLCAISYHKGWSPLETLHATIRKWSLAARPGDVFCTQVTAIVAVAVDRLARAEGACPNCLHSMLEYDDIDAVECGDLEQEVTCLHCGDRWIDVFSLTEQRYLRSE